MKRAIPEENVVYKFYYGEGKIYEFLYIGTDEKSGRLRMFNVKSKTITTMKPARFSYLHRFNLLSAKHVKSVPCPEPTVKPVVQTVIVKEPDIDVLKEEERLLKMLSGLSESVRMAIKEKIGKYPEELARDMSSAPDNASFSKYMSEYFAVMTIIQAAAFNK